MFRFRKLCGGAKAVHHGFEVKPALRNEPEEFSHGRLLLEIDCVPQELFA